MRYLGSVSRLATWVREALWDPVWGRGPLPEPPSRPPIVVPAWWRLKSYLTALFSAPLLASIMLGCSEKGAGSLTSVVSDL